MDCLEEKLDTLSEDCQKVVREYVEEVDEDPEIDEIFVRACTPFWDQHCQVCGLWKILRYVWICVLIYNVVAITVLNVISSAMAVIRTFTETKQDNVKSGHRQTVQHNQQFLQQSLTTGVT